MPLLSLFSEAFRTSLSLDGWTGAPCLHGPGRGTTWVERDGAKPHKLFSFARSKAKERWDLNPPIQMCRGGDLQLTWKHHSTPCHPGGPLTCSSFRVFAHSTRCFNPPRSCPPESL